MRKNYFAKKLIAYSMAFAVAFSTLTVSPVFVKEAKAAYEATWVTAPTVQKLSDGAILIANLESDNVSDTQITTKMFATGANVDVAKLTNVTVDEAAAGYEVKNTVDNDDVAAKGADYTTSAEVTEDIILDGKITTDITLKAHASSTGVWYKMEPAEGTFMAGKDTITYKYYKLRVLGTTETTPTNTYTIKRNSSNLGLYVCANKTTGDVISFHNLVEVTNLKATPAKAETLVRVGDAATLRVNASHESNRNITYKWFKAGKDISNDSNTLTFNSVTEEDIETYRCVVSDGVETKNVDLDLVKLSYDKVSDANTANAATTFNTYSATLDSTSGKLKNATVKLTSSLPSGDYRYVWLNGDADGKPVEMFETDKLAYKASNNSVIITLPTTTGTGGMDDKDDVLTGKKFVCYAIPASVYDNNEDIIDALEAFNAATAPSAKVNAINTLRTAEKALVTANKAEYVENFNLVKTTEAVNYTSSKVDVKLAQSLTLEAPVTTDASGKNVQYQWYKGSKQLGIGSCYKIDTVDVNDLGTIYCYANKCKTSHTCPADLNGCAFDQGYNSTNTLKTAAFNLSYVSNLTASGSDIMAKDQQKNVTLSVTADSELPISYTWTDVNGASAGTQNATAKNTYTFTQVTSANNFYTKAAKKHYTCTVTDGIRTIVIPIKITEESTFKVYKDETSLLADSNVTSTDTVAYEGLKDTSVKLSPIVVAANEEVEKAITYKWTKDSAAGEVVSTDKELTVNYPSSQESYVVSITDGIKTIQITYTVKQVLASSVTFTDIVLEGVESKTVYTGSEIRPIKVIGTTDSGNIILKENEDYTIDYKENTNVGIGFFSNIKLAGEFEGKEPGSFTKKDGIFYITKADNKLEIADKTVTLGQSVQPATVTNLSKGALTYTYYADADCTTEIDVPNKVGTYYVKATSVATANYNEATSNVATIKITGLGKTKIGSTSRTASSVKLPWTKVAGATKYRVYKKAAGATSFTKVADTTALSYNVTGLASATTYTFAVKAYGEGGWATVYATKQTTTAPAKVATPSVTAGSKKATVKFTKVARATGYQIYMAKGNGKYVKVKTTTSTSFTKTGLAKGATYKFKVRAYKTVGSNTYYGAFSSAKAVKVK